MKTKPIVTLDETDSPDIALDVAGTPVVIAKGLPGDDGRNRLTLTSLDSHTTVDLRSTRNALQSPRIVSCGNELIAFWLEGCNGQWRLWSAAAGESRLARPKAISGRRATMAFDVTVDVKGNIWVVWQEGYRVLGRRLSRGGWSKTFAVTAAGVDAWRPAVCAAPDAGVWVAWDVAETNTFNVFLTRLRSVRPSKAIRVTGSPDLAFAPALGCDRKGRVWLAYRQVEHWRRSKVYRLNPRSEIYVRCWDPEATAFSVCDSAELQSGGRVEIPRGRWPNGNLSEVQIFVDAAEHVHVLYRRIRMTGDRVVDKVHDWGWSVEEVVRVGDKWVGPRRLTCGEGFSTARPRLCETGSELLLAAQESAHTSAIPGRREPNALPQVNLYRVNPLPAAGPPAAVHSWEVSPAVLTPETREVLPRDGKEVLIWGDLHRHSDMSKCVSMVDGSVWDHLRWARGVAGLQFYAITDHHNHLNDYEWDRHIDWMERANEPGRFAAVLGFEGGSIGIGTAHVNLYGMDRESVWCARRTYQKYPDLRDLCAALVDAGMVGKVWVIPHFHASAPGGSEAQLPDELWDFAPFTEVVQTRGFSAAFAHLVAGAGQPVGFTGSSDHASPPWARSWTAVPWWQFQHAITGLWVEEITPAGVFAALARRRCMGSNGVKLQVDLTVNGKPMGGVLKTAKAPRVKVQARGTTGLLSLAVVRDGEVIHDVPLSGREQEVVWTDEDATRGEHYYYVRVRQEPEWGYHYAGETWTTPVWVRR